MTSPDGITWTSRTSADNDWTSVTYGNSLFVAVASSGSGDRVMTSSNGIDWTSRTSAADNDWMSVTYGNSLFVAVAVSETENGVMTSGQLTCVLGSTKILMGNGLFKEIKDIKRGDEVMEDIKTNKTNIVSRVISIKVENKNMIKIPKKILNNDEDLFITEVHPIWTNNDEKRLLSKDIEGAEKYVIKEDILYNLQYDTEGTYYANGIKIDSLSPYHKYYNLPKELYIDEKKYVKGIIIQDENDKRRNKPKLIKK